MYHVISTGVAATVLYLLSYLFCKTGFYTQNTHRKLWNTILALAFLSAGLAGVFLALQSNYKWNVQSVKSILKWHAECGIGLAFTGFFHFLWHFSYFRKLLNPSETQEIFIAPMTRTVRQNILNLFLIGFVSSSVQLLLLREMMNIAGGYELITGTFLGSWLIGSSIGAMMARRSMLNDIRKINLALSLSPLASILLLISLGRLFLKTGETPSFFISVIYTLLVLLPFCFVTGFTFIKMIFWAGSASNLSPGKSFSIETVGGVFAGITISILTSGFLNNYQLLLMIIVLNIAYILLSFYTSGRSMKATIGALTTTSIVLILLFHPDTFFRQQLLHGIKVRKTQDTSYGNITVGEYGGEQCIYYNQRLLSYQNDEIEREENIHYAMLQHNNPAKVLLISGDLGSHLGEVLKYQVEKVSYVERDPALIKTGQIVSDIQFDGLEIEYNDAYRFIKKTSEKYDVIILLLPPPSTLQLNRYYTTDFFAEVQNKLSDEGVFMCSPGSGENYYNKESTVLYSSVFNSLSGVFENVVPIVGNKLYYVASNSELSSSICSLTEKRKIKNLYVNSYYLSDDLLKAKSSEVISIMDPEIKQNTSALPIACFHFQSYNLSKNLDEKIPAIILLTLVFFMPVFTVRRKNMIMFTAAAALAGFEIIILLALQSVVGNMYQLTGLIIAGLMTGLAIGSGMNLTLIKPVKPVTTGILLVMLYTCAGLIFNEFLNIRSSFEAVLMILITTFIPAFLTGHLFRSLTEMKGSYSDPSSVYSADLTGSALGFIFLSGLAIPALGIQVTIFLLSALIFTGLLFGTIRNK